MLNIFSCMFEQFKLVRTRDICLHFWSLVATRVFRVRKVNCRERESGVDLASREVQVFHSEDQGVLLSTFLCCLVIHLTSVSNISYAEANGGIFILIAPLGITNTRTNLWTNVVRVICDQQYVLRAIC